MRRSWYIWHTCLPSPELIVSCRHTYQVMLAKSGCVLPYRDLKLENIFLSKEGDIMLGDYGLTMSTKQELAVSPVGTVEYMAPEVCSRSLHALRPCLTASAGLQAVIVNAMT